MKVEVLLYGTLRRYSSPESPGKWTGEIPDHSTISDLIEILGIDRREVAIACLNDVNSPDESIIGRDDEVMLVTHFGAG